jgi:hypothetical protein
VVRGRHDVVVGHQCAELMGRSGCLVDVVLVTSPHLCSSVRPRSHERRDQRPQLIGGSQGRTAMLDEALLQEIVDPSADDLSRSVRRS